MMEPKGIVGACERARDQWISVAERMPEKCTNVLVVVKDADPEDSVTVDFLDANGEWFWVTPDEVTHWMPLPEPPK